MDVNLQAVLVDGLQPMNHLLTSTPLLSIEFYDFGTILRKRTESGQVSYAVRPSQIAAALADKVGIETGLLPEGNLYYAQEGIKTIVIEYRKPQRTGIWVEGREEPYRIPMPGLILARSLRSDIPHYLIFAAKRRPTSLDDPLYVSVLPNTYGGGDICWGTVERARLDGAVPANLRFDWNLMLGAAFNNHAVSGKSKEHKNDIRKMYDALDSSRARRYPMDDLVKAHLSFGGLIERLRK